MVRQVQVVGESIDPVRPEEVGGLAVGGRADEVGQAVGTLGHEGPRVVEDAGHGGRLERLGDPVLEGDVWREDGAHDGQDDRGVLDVQVQAQRSIPQQLERLVEHGGASLLDDQQQRLARYGVAGELVGDAQGHVEVADQQGQILQLAG